MLSSMFEENELKQFFKTPKFLYSDSSSTRVFPKNHVLEDCINEIRMLIEKEEEAKFYRDIEAGLPFSEEVANRLGMLKDILVTT